MASSPRVSLGLPFPLHLYRCGREGWGNESDPGAELGSGVKRGSALRCHCRWSHLRRPTPASPWASAAGTREGLKPIPAKTVEICGCPHLIRFPSNGLIPNDRQQALPRTCTIRQRRNDLGDSLSTMFEGFPDFPSVSLLWGSGFSTRKCAHSQTQLKVRF